MKNLITEEWKAQLHNDDNGVIIDCRSNAEWQEGIIENATMIDLMNPEGFMEAANELDKDKNYYVYCRSGVRSVTACQVLESIGITNTFNLTGGVLSWDEDLVKPQ